MPDFPVGIFGLLAKNHSIKLTEPGRDQRLLAVGSCVLLHSKCLPLLVSSERRALHKPRLAGDPRHPSSGWEGGPGAGAPGIHTVVGASDLRTAGRPCLALPLAPLLGMDTGIGELNTGSWICVQSPSPLLHTRALFIMY